MKKFDCICRTFEENGIKKMWYSKDYVQQLKEDYAELLNRHNSSFENFKQLKAENKHLNDLLDNALNEIEENR